MGGKYYWTNGRIALVKEDIFLEWLKKRLRKTKSSPQSAHFLNDDVAFLSASKSKLLWTTDMLLEGTHFIIRKPEDYLRVGHKALAVNISDAASKSSSRLRGCLVSVAFGPSMTLKHAKALYEGIIRCSEEYDCPILGGDTNVWQGHLCINITVIADANGKSDFHCSKALDEDLIIVTDTLGGSIEGKHLDFNPRFKEAKTLTQRAKVNAMTDISDGIAKDLRKICNASNLGALLFADKIPINPRLKKLSNKLHRALNDGEDFELLFTMSQKSFLAYISKYDHAIDTTKLTAIGIMKKNLKGIFIQNSNSDKIRPLKGRGYIHSS